MNNRGFEENGINVICLRDIKNKNWREEEWELGEEEEKEVEEENSDKICIE